MRYLVKRVAFSDGPGLMFVQVSASEMILTPLVYVPGSGTVFWEGSCASGSSAAALLLSARRGAPVDVAFHEPAGTLRVASDAETGEMRLFGHVALLDSLLA
jgi:diaminopimelate epimerase